MVFSFLKTILKHVYRIDNVVVDDVLSPYNDASYCQRNKIKVKRIDRNTKI